MLNFSVPLLQRELISWTRPKGQINQWTTDITTTFVWWDWDWQWCYNILIFNLVPSVGIDNNNPFIWDWQWCYNIMTFQEDLEIKKLCSRLGSETWGQRLPNSEGVSLFVRLLPRMNVYWQKMVLAERFQVEIEDFDGHTRLASPHSWSQDLLAWGSLLIPWTMSLMTLGFCAFSLHMLPPL